MQSTEYYVICLTLRRRRREAYLAMSPPLIFRYICVDYGNNNEKREFCVRN